MVHVYDEVANQDSQKRKSLKCKPVDIPVFFHNGAYSNTETVTST